MAGNLKFSSSVVDIEPRDGVWTTRRKDRLGLATMEWSVVGTLALLVVLGFGFRLNQLGAIGFAEDEMNNKGRRRMKGFIFVKKWRRQNYNKMRR